jgi:hypothetical protein
MSSLDTRFSVVVTQEFDGSYSVFVTDYAARPTRSVKSMLFKSAAAARAEGNRIRTSWQYATASITHAAGVA